MPAAVLCKAFTCGAVVAAAYGVPGLRSNFVRLCAWYLLLNLLLCGAAVLLPGVQSANLCVYLPLSPGRLLLCCGGPYLPCCGRCYSALAGQGPAASLPFWSWTVPPCRCRRCATPAFSLQDPLSGRAVVVLHYPSVRDGLPQELRTFLDRYFACGTAPPPELRVRLVPCTTIAGHCVLPAVPAKGPARGSRRVQGFLAAFCRPETQQPWTALLGSELAVQLGIQRV